MGQESRGTSKMKPETVIRNLKRDLSRLHADLREIGLELSKTRGRATKAEQEVVEWKARFDMLLQRTPKVEE